MTTATEIFIIVWVIASIATVGLLIAHLLRTAGRRMQSRAHGGDTELHRRRAETEAVAEEHDIDDMLDAIAAYRRRGGRPDIGEELAAELVRSTYEDG
jgi:hypothetical protein